MSNIRVLIPLIILFFNLKCANENIANSNNNLVGMDPGIFIELIQENGAPVLFADVKVNKQLLQPIQRFDIPIGKEPSEASYQLNNRFFYKAEKSGIVRISIVHPDFKKIELNVEADLNRQKWEKITLYPKKEINANKMVTNRSSIPYYNSLLTIITDSIDNDLEKKMKKKGIKIVHTDLERRLTIIKIEEQCLKNKLSIIEFLQSKNKLNVYQVLEIGVTSVSCFSEGVYVELNNSPTSKNFKEVFNEKEIDSKIKKEKLFLKNRTPIDYLDFFQKIEAIEFVESITPANLNSILY